MLRSEGEEQAISGSHQLRKNHELMNHNTATVSAIPGARGQKALVYT